MTTKLPLDISYQMQPSVPLYSKYLRRVVYTHLHISPAMLFCIQLFLLAHYSTKSAIRVPNHLQIAKLKR